MNQDFKFSEKYKHFLEMTHNYFKTPRAVPVASIVAVTAWHINANDTCKFLFTNPLSSIFWISVGSFITNIGASLIHECLHVTARPIVPIMLFGSSAYHLSNTYLGRPKAPIAYSTQFKMELTHPEINKFNKNSTE